MTTCPACGHQWAVEHATRRKLKLEQIGDEWQVVAVGASRYYKRQLLRDYPWLEARHHRTSLYGGEGSTWTVEARRAR